MRLTTICCVYAPVNSFPPYLVSLFLFVLFSFVFSLYLVCRSFSCSSYIIFSFPCPSIFIFIFWSSRLLSPPWACSEFRFFPGFIWVYAFSHFFSSLYCFNCCISVLHILTTAECTPPGDIPAYPWPSCIIIMISVCFCGSENIFQSLEAFFPRFKGREK